VGGDARESLLATLPATERAIVERHVIDGETLADIGSSLGISRQRVHQLLARALGRLRDNPLGINRLIAATIG
jgi:RNA polymerase sigma factor (sigma-70 family)